MTPHPQAAELMAMAQDMNTQMQLEVEPGKWAMCGYKEALQIIAYEKCNVRIKPRTIRIGDVEVPEPLRVAPNVLATFWVVAPNYQPGIFMQKFDGSSSHRLWIVRGICQATEQGAQQMLAALIKQLGGEG